MSRSIIPTDEEVARLIADSVKKNATTKPAPFVPTDVKYINKSFLQNTIRSVESHNRREEVEECWRQYELNKKHVPSTQDNHEGNAYEDMRSQWAKRKIDAILSSTPTVKGLVEEESDSSSTSSSSSSSNSSDTKKRRKSKKSKKHKKEKKKHKHSKKAKKTKKS